MHIHAIKNAGGYALIPLLVFVSSFLGAGLLLDDFYAFNAPLAVVLGITSAFILLKGPVKAKTDALIRGCGDSKIITMCLIYLLAGAFATVTKAMGGVDATVQLGLSLIPLEYLALGVFLLAAFLSTATGTSVGAVVALGPIAVGLAEQSGGSMPLLLGALLGGAMFGDNLSIISDTTIAATQTQDCSMKDKFRLNLFIAGPAAVVTLLLLLLAGSNTPAVNQLTAEGSYSLWLILPYLLVIFLAVAGVNVFVVLMVGTLFSGVFGIWSGAFSPLEFSQQVYTGFTSMTEIFLLSMLTGGLAAMVQEAGGIQFLLHKIKRAVRSNRSAQAGTAALVALTNAAIANNTVSIVVAGPLAKEIGGEYKVDKRKSAALLDIYACIAQGLLPYGAQMLILLSFSGGLVAYTDLLPYAWYLFLLLLFSLLAIYVPWFDRFLKLEHSKAAEIHKKSRKAA
jgi:Na+/H+ antiporter NhaC